MDLDNPSYFSVATDEPDFAFAELRRKKDSDLSPELHRHTPSKQGSRRYFLRSLSSNSTNSNQELLILGEPRLSDMDPDIARKQPSRSNSLKKENARYILLPTAEESNRDYEENEVFLDETGARFTKSGQGGSPRGYMSPRRHSISAFNSRERVNSVTSSTRSFKEDFSIQETAAMISAIDEHSLRHKSFPRKRCLMCSKGTLSRQRTNMDDILIVSLKASKPANLWVDYFVSYFEQIRKQAPFKINIAYLEDGFTSKVEEKSFTENASGVKLQLVVVCPEFLNFIVQHPEESVKLTNLLLPDRTLALLLGVTDADVTELHHKALSSYFQWQRQSVGQDQDQTFTKDFLNQAMVILSKIWKQQSAVISQEKSCFSVTPKKVKQGQNSVFIMLTYPLQKEDIVKVSIERNGVLHEITSMKKRNPYIIKISVPENLTDTTTIVNVLVEKNGSIIGSRPIKCESKLRELEQILRTMNTPVDFMCQTLGFSPADREQLDNWLVHGFQKNIPPHLNLLGSHNTPFAASISVHKHSNEEFPSLLHFAAKFGLEKLAMQLMECPGAEIAYEIRNKDDMIPTEIADNNGFHSLSNLLKGYKNMNEMTDAYTRLKELSLKAKEEDDGYLIPKEAENFYKQCPAPRPINPEMTRSCPNSITTPSSDCEGSLYLAMDRTAIAFSREDLRPHLEEMSTFKTAEESLQSSSQKKLNKTIEEDKYQRELAEIINDFKNQVHSITQVEQLVNEWKNRNDVQKSFKEKEEQLNEMRKRYEKMQQEFKGKNKSVSPMEKWKRFFSRSSKKSIEVKSEESTSVSIITGPALSLNQSARPISSLSTSSSGSSGRMSTISGCSVGDSGTHSDNEERRLMLANNNTDHDFKHGDINKTLLEIYYTPVPIPKPVKFPMSYFETIEENRPTRPETLPLVPEQFYIQFPPNGQPVEDLSSPSQCKNEISSPHNEYMNLMVPNHHEYMNLKPET